MHVCFHGLILHCFVFYLFQLCASGVLCVSLFNFCVSKQTCTQASRFATGTTTFEHFLNLSKTSLFLLNLILRRTFVFDKTFVILCGTICEKYTFNVNFLVCFTIERCWRFATITSNLKSSVVFLHYISVIMLENMTIRKFIFWLQLCNQKCEMNN